MKRGHFLGGLALAVLWAGAAETAKVGCPIAKAPDEIPTYRMLPEDGYQLPKILPANQQRVDGSRSMKFDFNDDGIAETVVCDSTGGSGGNAWRIQRIRPSQKWEDVGEFFGFPMLAEKSGGWYQIVDVYKCGWAEKIFSVYTFQNGLYTRVRRERQRYDTFTVEVETGLQPYATNGLSALSSRFERSLRSELNSCEKPFNQNGLVVEFSGAACVFTCPEFKIELARKIENNVLYEVEGGPVGHECSFTPQAAAEHKTAVQQALKNLPKLLVPINVDERVAKPIPLTSEVKLLVPVSTNEPAADVR